MVDLDMCEDEIWSVPNGDFELVQLNDKLVCLVKKGVKLPLEVKKLISSMS